MVGVDKKLILYGGRSFDIFSGIDTFDDYTKHWSHHSAQYMQTPKLKPKRKLYQKMTQNTDDIEKRLFGKYGHSMCVFQNQVVIFGGEV